MNEKTNQYIVPPLQLVITAYELQQDGSYKAIVTHTFHADSQDEAYNILKAHTITDSFFKASVTTGKLTWKGGEIILKSSEPRLLFP